MQYKIKFHEKVLLLHQHCGQTIYCTDSIYSKFIVIDITNGISFRDALMSRRLQISAVMIHSHPQRIYMLGSKRYPFWIHLLCVKRPVPNLRLFVNNLMHNQNLLLLLLPNNCLRFTWSKESLCLPTTSPSLSITFQTFLFTPYKDTNLPFVLNFHITWVLA